MGTILPFMSLCTHPKNLQTHWSLSKCALQEAEIPKVVSRVLLKICG